MLVSRCTPWVIFDQSALNTGVSNRNGRHHLDDQLLETTAATYGPAESGPVVFRKLVCAVWFATRRRAIRTSLTHIDIQKPTCGQLANTPQADADFLGAMYIGWYNGVAKKNAINLTRVKDAIRNLVVYCKANKDKRVTQAIDAIRKDARR
jgi:hypothetical protein